MKTKFLVMGAFLLLLAVGLASCSAPATPCPTAVPCPEADCPACPDCPAVECPAVEECPTCPEPEPMPEPVVKEAPFEAAWAESPHNDGEAEAFNHWNEDDPAEVPTSCANCHTSQGYMEYVATGEVSEAIPAPAGTIQCVACHNEATAALTSVTFPSGAVIDGLGAEARCMVCHQGRASKLSVDSSLEELGLTEDLDTINEELGFINIHYYAAAATLYGTATQGGYEYDGKAYDYKNDHVEGYDTCIGCHSPHSLELKLEECAVCHQGVGSVEDVRAIRMAGSLVDYDGDGDVEEGISEEVAGLRDMLYQAIQAYASEVAGTPIEYDSQSYPYWFDDAGERYVSWTGRLLKAAYNFQVATKDPGTYAHGGKYIIQLLYDSIDDLNTVTSTPVDLSGAHRIDAGHFAGSEEAFRHWDEDGEVQSSCAKCHSATGLPTFLKEGVNISEPLANGLNCATCHNDLSTFTIVEIESVTFPSGATLAFADATDKSMMCLNCHQGRQSSSGIAGRIGDLGDDEVSDSLSFSNPHYFAAGATLFGSDAAGAYQYEGSEYNGYNQHVPGYNTCKGCHNVHSLKVKADECSACHPVVAAYEDLPKIRITPGDFDGDGDETEGIAGEIETMHEMLLAGMQAYTEAQGLPGIEYDSHAYPYWFDDAGESYASWTPTLLRSAYNYQWVAKDPGAFGHNAMYILQVLYDTLNDVGVNTSNMIRPDVKSAE